MSKLKPITIKQWVREQRKKDYRFNVSAFCRKIGISRQAFYRHMKDPGTRWTLEHAKAIYRHYKIRVHAIG